MDDSFVERSAGGHVSSGAGYDNQFKQFNNYDDAERPDFAERIGSVADSAGAVLDTEWRWTDPDATRVPFAIGQ